MKSRILLTVGFTLVAVTCGVAFSLIDYQRGTEVYVKAASENLRSGPDGEILGSLNKGTSMVVLEDSPKWVKVRLEGWIWKASLTDSKLALAGNVYRALQIIVKDRATADKVLRRLRAGEDFENVAREVSIGPAAKRGGDLGYFKKGDFKPELETAILNLKPGQISEIIQTE
ncbi:MAG: hypothetical protein D6743_18225, partial [Calditrichaeota bacterium]